MGLTEYTQGSGYPAKNTGNACERSRGLRSRSGFTLIEVLIGATVLAVGLLGLATLYPVAYLNVDSGGKRTEATALAQSFMEQLRTRVRDVPTFDGVLGAFPANGFNGLDTNNCQGDPLCVAWLQAVDMANNGQLPQGRAQVTMICRDGAGNPVPNPPPNDDCTPPSQDSWIAIVNVTVNWTDLRGPRQVTLTTRMVRP